MKLATAIVALMVAGSAANAADLGKGFTFGGEANLEYNVSNEALGATLTPKLAYTGIDKVELAVETELALVETGEVVLFDRYINEGRTLPTLDLTATYFVSPALEAYAGTSYDLDAKERGDIVVGVTFSF